MSVKLKDDELYGGGKKGSSVDTKTEDKENPNPYAPSTPPTLKDYITTTWDESTKGQDALGGYNSAKDAVDNYGDFTYKDYMESEAVKGAGDALNAHLANKPGEYQSQWQTQLDDLMNQIMNRDKFSYDLNGDALYQQYKDKYIQQGKMAMADTMGQAAAMTGGYGSSYAQSVGQQAYQGQLDNLNDVVPELYQMALDRYNQEGQDLYNQYGMVMDRENTDYGRYRDTVSDWMTDRGYLTDRYESERGFDYSKYIDDRNLDYTLHQEGYQKLMDALGIAQGDYYNGADMFYTEQGIKNDAAWKEYQASAGGGGAPFADTLWGETGVPQDNGTRQFINSEGKTVTLGEGINPYTHTKHPDLKYGACSNGYQPDNIGGHKLAKAKHNGVTITTNITGKKQNVWTVGGKYYLWRGDLNEYIEVDISDIIG